MSFVRQKVAAIIGGGLCPDIINIITLLNHTLTRAQLLKHFAQF